MEISAQSVVDNVIKLQVIRTVKSYTWQFVSGLHKVPCGTQRAKRPSEIVEKCKQVGKKKSVRNLGKDQKLRETMSTCCLPMLPGSARGHVTIFSLIVNTNLKNKHKKILINNTAYFVKSF